MRVLIVDDSAFMRRAISQMLSEAPDIQVVGTARNGQEGVEMADRLEPDVITMDVEMPVMDGLTALRHIVRKSSARVLMLSSLTVEDSRVALQALRLGAADVMAKDMSQVSLSITNIKQDLITRVRALGAARPRKLATTTPTRPPPGGDEPPVFRPGQFDLICIASSTGGPPVLEEILSALPATLVAPVVVAQHMPELFTRSMAQRLGEICRLRVHHVADRMPMERQGIYICPGGAHTHVHKVGLAKFELRVSADPVEAVYRPSADVLIGTAAAAAGSRVLAIVLTGIGEDGLRGCRALHEQHGVILAQDQESCVVYGMPKAVTQSALATASLAPAAIARSLCTLARPDAAQPRAVA
ncbi:MAG: chemotaxis-specific protein-glutamate methyltransferase CheB [Phycisphaeraceae bacterium]